MGLADKEAKLRSVKNIWSAGLTYNRHPKTQGWVPEDYPSRFTRPHLFLALLFFFSPRPSALSQTDASLHLVSPFDRQTL